MEITEIRIKLMDDSGDRLRAFCSVTLDGAFVIRDLKIIEGPNGLFVAMPSRKLTARCPECGCKNHLRATYCNHCGVGLETHHTPRDDEGRPKLYADVAHPINSNCREMMQRRLLESFDVELDRSQQPDYVSNYHDYDSDAGDWIEESYEAPAARKEQQATTTYAANSAHAPAAQGPHHRQTRETTSRTSHESSESSESSG
ncbi:MAG: SpoVG family protein, partial [Planctomycetales bacterium]